MTTDMDQDLLSYSNRSPRPMKEQIYHQMSMDVYPERQLKFSSIWYMPSLQSPKI